MQIVGSTYIHRLNVPYIGIDPAFPHRVNSFDNVALNYSDAPLVITYLLKKIFSDKSSTVI